MRDLQELQKTQDLQQTQVTQTTKATPVASKRTELFAKHLEHGGLMVNFSGWELPLHYGSQLKEQQIVRTDVGVFDVSHMQAIDILGSGAQQFLAKLLANDINKLKQPGRALYSCMLNHAGGILDDLIAYYISENHYRLVVNAGTYIKDLAWIFKQSAGLSVEVIGNLDYTILAIQGPKVRVRLAGLLQQHQVLSTAVAEILALKKFHCLTIGEYFIACTGYTGEDGFEFMLPRKDAAQFWDLLMAQQIHPIGLGARDILRLEAGLNLYGTDMTEADTPFSSNLGWTVDLKDPTRDFIGKAALTTKTELQHNTTEQLLGVILADKGMLRAGQKLYNLEAMGVATAMEPLANLAHQECGVITSSTFSPQLQKSIAFARVAINGAVKPAYLVDVRGKLLKVIPSKLPFYKA
jgi:aminomethyltransferase